MDRQSEKQDGRDLRNGQRGDAAAGGDERDVVQTECQWLTPPQVARRWGVKAEKVRGWIVAGELRAIDVAAKRSGRPRYRVHEADLLIFERRREVKPPPKVQRRKRAPADVIEFF